MDMTLAEIQKHLSALRLHGMNATLEPRLIQANQGASFVEVRFPPKSRQKIV